MRAAYLVSADPDFRRDVDVLAKALDEQPVMTGEDVERLLAEEAIA